MAFEEYGYEAPEKTGTADATYEAELPEKKKTPQEAA